MTLSPEQFNKLATKEDLVGIKSDIVEMKEGINNILTAVDGLTKKVVDIEHAFVSNQAAHDRFEKRLTRIEQNLKLEPLFDY
jgi:hypothetical protein